MMARSPTDPAVVLRPLEPSDRDALIEFIASLPADALLFLRRDIRRPEEVDRWLAATQGEGMATTIACTPDGTVTGYVVVDRGELPWRRHVAEVRVLVAPSPQDAVLLHRLLQDGLDSALRQGAAKLVVRLTPEQRDERAVLQRLGFECEATLRKHVRDTAGAPHDLEIHSIDLEERRGEACAECGRDAPQGLTLEGRHLCWECYGLEGMELGVG